MNVLVADFPAERAWRHSDTARLNVFANTETAIGSLDELLFPSCQSSDVLCTRLPRNHRLREYHIALGFRHTERACTSEASNARNVYDLLRSPIHTQWLEETVTTCGARIIPWAITRESAELLDRHGAQDHPPADIVARVNSKVWASEIRYHILRQDHSRLARSTQELLERGRHHLNHSRAFVVKEPHGVAGSGTLLVQTERRLLHLVQSLSMQERAGCRVELIIEPYLTKTADFSAYFDVRRDGTIEHIGLHQAVMNGFTWYSLMPASPSVEAAVHASRYFEIVGEICRALHREGYFGPVCIDSLILDSGEIFPLVEVNARLSMGRINHQLDIALERFGRRSYFSNVRTSLQRERLSELLDALIDIKGLFGVDTNRGIIPLSSNTLGSAREPGRLYFCVPFRDPSDVPPQVTMLHATLRKLGAAIF